MMSAFCTLLCVVCLRPFWLCSSEPGAYQPSNTDQQMSFRNRWSERIEGRGLSGGSYPAPLLLASVQHVNSWLIYQHRVDYSIRGIFTRCRWFARQMESGFSSGTYIQHLIYAKKLGNMFDEGGTLSSLLGEGG